MPHGNGKAAQLRVIALLDRSKERIHVHMDDAPREIVLKYRISERHDEGEKPPGRKKALNEKSIMPAARLEESP